MVQFSVSGTGFKAKTPVRARIYRGCSSNRQQHRFSTRVSFQVVDTNAAVTSFESVFTSCHISTVFYSTSWQSLSNIRKHTSHNRKHVDPHENTEKHNLIPTDGLRHKEGWEEM